MTTTSDRMCRAESCQHSGPHSITETCPSTMEEMYYIQGLQTAYEDSAQIVEQSCPEHGSNSHWEGQEVKPENCRHKRLAEKLRLRGKNDDND